MYFAWLQIFMLAGIIVGPVVAKKWGMIRTIVFTELASIPFMLILAFTTKLSFAIGAFFIRGALMNMAQPISTHFAMEAVEEKEHPLVNSLIALAWTLSWVFSAGLGGKLIELYSFAPPLVVAAGLYVASAALYYYYFAKEEKKIFKPEPVTLQETG
jgi:predicted MFS family arabinose efflux permease